MRWGMGHDRALRQRLGIQLQETQLADKLTVEETLRLFRSFYRDAQAVDDVLALVELEEKRGSWVNKLSGGQKQRLAVACALVSRPEFLFLDEPTTGLDPQSRRQLWDVVTAFRARGGSVLLTTHYMEEAERLCDRVAIMDHGQMIALGTPRQLIASLGAEHVVEFALADGAGRAPSVDELAVLPGVQAVRPAADRCALKVGVVRAAGDSALAATLDRSPALAAGVLDTGAARVALRTGHIALLVVPGDPLVYRYDSTRTESRLARLEVDEALQRARGRADPLLARDERVTEPGSRYIDFLIPGLLGMNLMGSGLWGVGFSVVQARTKRLLKRFMATPMRKSHYLLSFVLSRLTFLFVEVAALVGFGWWIFDVGVRGSVAALAGITILGSLSFAGLGMLVASRARTIEAVSGLMNLVMLPMWILSGTFFSYARFPDAMQPVVRALPLTALNDALRAG